MKLLLTLTMTTAISIGLIGCKSTPKATAANDKTIPERIGDDAKTVGHDTLDIVSDGLEAIGKAGEAVVDAFDGDKETDN